MQTDQLKALRVICVLIFIADVLQITLFSDYVGAKYFPVYVAAAFILPIYILFVSGLIAGRHDK